MSTFEMLVFFVLVASVWFFTTETYQQFVTKFLPQHEARHARVWRAAATLVPVVACSSITITIGLQEIMYSDLGKDAIEGWYGERVPIQAPSLLQVFFVLSLITATLAWLGFRRNPATSQVRVVTIDDVLGEDEPDAESDWEDEVDPPMSTPRRAPSEVNEIHFRRGTVA